MPAPKDPIKYAEYCRKIGESIKNLPADIKKKQSDAVSKALKGKPRSKEVCEKISAGQMGKKRPNYNDHLSDETRKKLGDHTRGIKRSKQNCKNIGDGLRGKPKTEEHTMKMVETKLGGFCYSHVIYPRNPIYCELWKDVNPRVHAFFNYKCVECGAPENGLSHIGHHVFYVKEACCWYDESGIYYTNLNARDHTEKDYCIGENPNYFAILCPHCHGKAGGNFSNRKKWADHFKELIDTKYGGKCYLTKEEMELNDTLKYS